MRTYIYIYIYICVCVRACAHACRQRQRQRRQQHQQHNKTRVRIDAPPSAEPSRMTTAKQKQLHIETVDGNISAPPTKDSANTRR